MPDSDSTTTTTDAPTTPAHEDNGNNANGTENRTFSQSELNAIVQDRIARERGRFANYKELETKAAEYDKLEAERMSEVERATNEATASRDRAEKAETALKSERLRNAVYTGSIKAGVVDPDAVLALIERDSLIDSDGNPSGIDDAIAALLEAKPYLRANTNPAKPVGNIGNGTRADTATSGGFTRSQLKDSKFFEDNKADIFKALAEGRISED